MPCLGTTETIQRAGLLEATSMTERTIPVTGNPFNITVVLWPRYWAKRQRRASFGSVISTGCMHHRRSRYAKRFRDHLHDIEQPLTMIPMRVARRLFNIRKPRSLGAVPGLTVSSSLCLESSAAP